MRLTKVYNLDPGLPIKGLPRQLIAHTSFYSSEINYCCIVPNSFLKNYIMNLCIVCELTVRPHQQALLCDGRQRWQHCTCNTGISQTDYREAVHLDQSINWRCDSCEEPAPLLNSTYLEADRESTPLRFSDNNLQSDLRSVYGAFNLLSNIIKSTPLNNNPYN